MEERECSTKMIVRGKKETKGERGSDRKRGSVRKQGSELDLRVSKVKEVVLGGEGITMVSSGACQEDKRGTGRRGADRRKSPGGASRASRSRSSAPS